MEQSCLRVYARIEIRVCICMFSLKYCMFIYKNIQFNDRKFVRIIDDLSAEETIVDRIPQKSYF